MRLPLPPALGELETAALCALWDSAEPLSVREVLERVKRRPGLAYTTVLTVLDRLHDKRLVAREKHGKAFVYWPRVSRQGWLGGRAAHVLTEARGPVDREVLLAFLDSAQSADPELLDRLSALIEERRREREK
ncbi:MAG: BlaI/MecI/CopY family transcriptional regulator [Polyangiaceae bacterium]